jgi:HEAT repeat protein
MFEAIGPSEDPLNSASAFTGAKLRDGSMSVGEVERLLVELGLAPPAAAAIVAEVCRGMVLPDHQQKPEPCTQVTPDNPKSLPSRRDDRTESGEPSPGATRSIDVQVDMGLFPEFQAVTRHADILRLAADLDVPQELAEAPIGLSWRAVAPRLVRRLMRDLGLTRESAEDVVETWARILALASPKAAAAEAAPNTSTAVTAGHPMSAPAAPPLDAPPQAVRAEIRFRRSWARLLVEPTIAAVGGALAGGGILTVLPTLGDAFMGAYLGGIAGALGGLVDAIDWRFGRPIARRAAILIWCVVLLGCLGLNGYTLVHLLNRRGNMPDATEVQWVVALALAAGMVLGIVWAIRFKAGVHGLARVGGMCGGAAAGALGAALGVPGVIGAAALGSGLGVADAILGAGEQREGSEIEHPVNRVLAGTLFGAGAAFLGLVGAWLAWEWRSRGLSPYLLALGALEGGLFGLFDGRKKPGFRLLRRTWLPMAVGLVLFVAAMPCYMAAQPCYDGKRRAEWLVAFRQTDPNVRLQAAEVLSTNPPPLSAAIIAIAGGSPPLHGGKLADFEVRVKEERDEKRRRRVSGALIRMGPQAVPALVEIMRSAPEDDGRARGFAAEVLGKIGGPAVEALIELLQDERIGHRISASYALAAIGAEAAPAVTALTELLKDSDASTRRAAAHALERIGAPARFAIPDLLAALHDEDRRVRANAAHALWQIDRRGKEIISVLLEELADEQENPAWFGAARVLGEIGPDAKVAVPRLVELARSPRIPWFCRDIAVEALTRIDPASVKLVHAK